jgi:hypothetical protein
MVMATMYENLCGNCVGDICMTFHARAFDFFIPLQIDFSPCIFNRESTEFENWKLGYFVFTMSKKKRYYLLPSFISDTNSL